MNDNYYGEASMSKIMTGTVDMRALNVKAMEVANKRKDFTPDWSIVSVLRTAEEQNELWYKGRDDQGREMYATLIVTHCDGYFDESIHQSGDATDFVPLDENGKAEWKDKAAFAIVAACYFEAATELGLRIRWGGNFSNLYDGGHIEIIRD